MTLLFGVCFFLCFPKFSAGSGLSKAAESTILPKLVTSNVQMIFHSSSKTILIARGFKSLGYNGQSAFPTFYQEQNLVGKEHKEEERSMVVSLSS